MDLQAEKQLSRELESGEKLLWKGQPSPSRYAQATLPVFLFAIPWTIFACFWVGMASWGVMNFKESPWLMKLFPLFGLLFIWKGLSMLTLPLRKMREASRTYYGITNRRVIIIVDGKRRTITSFDKSSLGNISRTESGNTADITWDGGNDKQTDSSILRLGKYMQPTNSSHQPWAGLLGVSNAKDVELLLRKKQESPQ